MLAMIETRAGLEAVDAIVGHGGARRRLHRPVGPLPRPRRAPGAAARGRRRARGDRDGPRGGGGRREAVRPALPDAEDAARFAAEGFPMVTAGGDAAPARGAGGGAGAARGGGVSGAPGRGQHRPAAAGRRAPGPAVDERDLQGAGGRAAWPRGPRGWTATSRPTSASTAGPTRPSTPTRRRTRRGGRRSSGRPLGPGAFGENLTVAGLDVTGAVIGERWRVGHHRARGLPAAPAVLEAGHPLRRPADGQALRAGRAAGRLPPRDRARRARRRRPGRGGLAGRRTTSASGSSSGRSCTTTTASPPGRRRRRRCPRRSPPGCASARPRPRTPSARPSCGAWPPSRCRA